MPGADQFKPVGNDGAVFRCPICKTLLPHAGVEAFPFCSQRCRLVDLDNWLEGKYTASRPMDPTDHDEDQPRPSDRRGPGAGA